MEGTMLKPQQAISLLTLNGFFDLLGIDLNELINFLRFIDDDKAKHLIEVYDSLSARQKGKLDLDKLADRAGYSKASVRSIIISTLVEYEIDCSRLLLALSMPLVVKKTIQSALGDGPDSFKDRKILMNYYLSKISEHQAERRKEFEWTWK